ncbi:hypothetical protein [Mesorhizobium sp. B2-4-6]|uniref:hypothetical protein n=1 Tax=Mesorhizobium sp. B2-4-6 TaxID=2589943 RepID=UPI0015E29EE9|nr:hypothetical protein [Mesorhizobium sp. B2-4-6]
MSSAISPIEVTEESSSTAVRPISPNWALHERGLSETDAKAHVDAVIAKVEDAKTKAKQAADSARKPQPLSPSSVPSSLVSPRALHYSGPGSS